MYYSRLVYNALKFFFSLDSVNFSLFSCLLCLGCDEIEIYILRHFSTFELQSHFVVTMENNLLTATTRVKESEDNIQLLQKLIVLKSTIVSNDILAAKRRNLPSKFIALIDYLKQLRKSKESMGEKLQVVIFSMWSEVLR